MTDTPPEPIPGAAIARLVGGIVVIVAVALVVHGLGISDIHALERTANSAGAVSMLVFVVAYVALTVAFVPGSIPSVAAGMLFGTGAGSLLVWLGATLGATAAFLIARGAGRPITRRIGSRTLDRVDALLDRHGRSSVLLVRLVPLVPFNASNYAFGLTAIALPTYVIGTAIGIIPGVVLRVAFGESLLDIGSERFWWSTSILVAMTVVSGAVALHLHARRKDQP